jgi:hypothetical protein
MAQFPRKLNPPSAMKQRMAPADLVRFLAKVAVCPVTGCWIWTGHKDSKGYGQFHFAGAARWAHRVVYATFRGPLKFGEEVDHKRPCHNPQCVCPWHLRKLTHSENSADANRRRQRSAPRIPNDGIPI